MLKFTKAMLGIIAALMITTSLYGGDKKCENDNCKIIAGKVFIGDFADVPPGTNSSRALFTFNDDGTLFIVDSDQQGETQFFVFSSPVGYWKLECGILKIFVVNFNYPKLITCDHPESESCTSRPAQTIAVQNGCLTPSNGVTEWSGVLEFNRYPFNSDINNLPAPLAGPFLTNLKLTLVQKNFSCVN